MSRYPLFNRAALDLRHLSERGHDLTADTCLELKARESSISAVRFALLQRRFLQARRNGRPVVLMMGGHPIKLELSRYLIDLIERGHITNIATNGAGMIHDFELAMVGGTSENVAK